MNWLVRVGASCALLFVSVWAVAEEWSLPIMQSREQTQEQIGIVLRNEYSYVGFMHPDKHTGAFLAGDFKVLPRVLDNGEKTLDEEEALPRYFTRFDCRAFTAGKNGKPLKSADGWTCSNTSKSVTADCSFGSEKELVAHVVAELSSDKAVMTINADFANHGTRSLKIIFKPQFATLIQELQNLKVVIPQKVVRYQVSGKVEYWRTTVTELDGNYKRYWWRKIAEADKQMAGRNLQLEKIAFNHPKIVSPGFFGLFELRGNNAMVWDLGENSTLSDLELRWQKDLVRVTPSWTVEVPAGEKKKISFRLLPVKDMVRVDTIKGDWLFGYRSRNEMLRVQFLPLMPYNRVIININLSSAQGNSLTNQPSEAPKMGPLQPGKLDYRISTPLQENKRYPIKLSITDLQSNQPIIELEDVVTP